MFVRLPPDYRKHWLIIQREVSMILNFLFRVWCISLLIKVERSSDCPLITVMLPASIWSVGHQWGIGAPLSSWVGKTAHGQNTRLVSTGDWDPRQLSLFPNTWGKKYLEIRRYNFSKSVNSSRSQRPVEMCCVLGRVYHMLSETGCKIYIDQAYSCPRD